MDMREPDGEGAERLRAGWRGRRALGVGAMLAVVVTLVAGFGALALSKNALTLPPQLASGSTLSWQVYRDPLGLFTMRLPPGWTAHAELGSYTEGDRQGGFNARDENVIFGDPTRGAGSATIGVYIMQIPDSPVAAAMNCSARVHETATFNGYPADTSQPAVILFESANAHFQIGETIPGVLAPIGIGGSLETSPPPPTPTPLPASTVATDRALLSDALASFQPTDAQPLACH